MERLLDEAEEAVIGCLLCGDRPEIYDMLEPEMFTDNLMRGLYEAMKGCWKSGNNPDVVFADEWFKKQNVDGGRYLKEIVSLAPAGYDAVTDAKIVKERYVRELVEKITNLKKGDIYGEIDRITRELNAITGEQNGSEDISEQDNSDMYEESSAILCGYHSIDESTDGFEKGDLITIGARPSVGKSAFVLQMAVQMIEKGHSVAYYNLEMPKKQVKQRLISHLSGLPLNLVKHPTKLNEQNLAKFNIGMEKMKGLKGFYVANDLKEVSAIRRDVKAKKPDVVIIDYLQLVKVGNRYQGNRYAEVGEISHALKGMAMELQIPVVVLVQLNRVSAGKENKEPGMSEIRESGDIEQDSSVIILLWDKDAEFPRTKKGVKVEKNRQGVGGKFEFKFNGSLMQFEDKEFEKTDMPWE